MITVSDVSVSFSEKPLFKDVNLKFNKGNCYGITGANGAGKSTFLKLLSGELEKDSGEIFMTPGERMAVLKQDHFAFDEYSVKDTVMMGFPKLYEVSKERDAIYAKLKKMVFVLQNLKLSLVNLVDMKLKIKLNRCFLDLVWKKNTTIK